MKKFWFILLIINVVCLLNACSDEEEALKHDGPVVDYVLPSYVMKGTKLVIPGKGYSPDAELYFKDKNGVTTQMTLEKIVNTGILFTVPQDMARGIYTVILKQDGEWELGSTKIAEIIKVKRVKSLAFGMDGEAFGNNELKYDNDNRLISFQVFEGTYTVAYEGNMIKVTSPDDRSFNYLLQDGRVVSSEDNGETSDWSYTADGFLENAAGIHYTYDNGNLVTTDLNDMAFAPFEYEDSSVNPGLIDVAACMMYFNGIMGDVEFMAYLLGINGKQSVHLPSGVTGWGPMVYSWENNDPQGDLKRFTLDMTATFGFDMFVNLVYEMGEILVME